MTRSSICKSGARRGPPITIARFNFTTGLWFVLPPWPATLGYPPSQLLERELGRVMREATFERTVFFVRNLGFVSPTQARRISFEESLRFEQIHEEVYRESGFNLIFVQGGPLIARVSQIRQIVERAVCEKTQTLHTS